jgi:DNA-binding transcriptional ArsR family regulator
LDKDITPSFPKRLQDHMIKELAKERAEIYQVFSNDKRVLIFWLLAKNETMSVNAVAEAIETTVQNTSQHLRIMKAKNILDSTRDGQTILYRIADTEEGRFSLYIHRKIIEDMQKAHPENEPHYFDIKLSDDLYDR